MIRDDIKQSFITGNLNKSIDLIRAELIDQGYPIEDIDETLAFLNSQNLLQKKEKPKSNSVIIIILLIAIFILIFGVIILFILNINPLKQETENNNEQETEIIYLSTKIFNTSNLSLISQEEVAKHEKLSAYLMNCTKVYAIFNGNETDYVGSVTIEPIGNLCRVTYESGVMDSCDYTREQINISYDSLPDERLKSFFGSVYYSTFVIKLKMRLISEFITEQINETYIKLNKPGNLTLYPQLDRYNETFSNPRTGQEEIVQCHYSDK